MDTHGFEWKFVRHLATNLAAFHCLNEQRVRKLLKKWWEGGKLPYTLANDTPLDKACSLIEPAKALNMLEINDIADVEYKDKFVEDILNSTYTPLFTIEELAEVTEEFLSFQESNRDHIIETGFPKAIFSRSLWFDMHLSRLNYVKLPIDLPNTSGIPQEDRDRFENHLLGSLNERAAQDYNSIWAKEPLIINYGFTKTPNPKRLYSDKFLLCTLNYEMRDGGLYDPDGNEVEICPYSEAPVIDQIDENTAARLGRSREKLFNLRIEILNHLLDLAARNVAITDAVDLWNDCVSVIANYLTVDEAKCLVEDGKCLGCTNERWCKKSAYPMITHFHFNAGLSELLFVVIHFIQELTIGTMDKTKTALKEIAPYPSISSYYEAFDQPWMPVLDRAILQFETLSNQRYDFYVGLKKRFDDVIKEDEPRTSLKSGIGAWSGGSDNILMSVLSNFISEAKEKKRTVGFTKSADTLVISLIKGKLAQDGSYYTLERDGKRALIEATKLDPFLESIETKKEKAILPIRTPAGSVWEKLTIEFFNEDAEAVEITYGDITDARDHVKMGMFDGRTTYKQPNKQWRLLVEVAKNNGCFEWSSYKKLKQHESFSKKTFSELRRDLKKVFPDLIGHPFKQYRKEKAYQTSFTIGFREE